MIFPQQRFSPSPQLPGPWSKVKIEIGLDLRESFLLDILISLFIFELSVKSLKPLFELCDLVLERLELDECLPLFHQSPMV